MNYSQEQQERINRVQKVLKNKEEGWSDKQLCMCVQIGDMSCTDAVMADSPEAWELVFKYSQRIKSSHKQLIRQSLIDCASNNKRKVFNWLQETYHSKLSIESLETINGRILKILLEKGGYEALSDAVYFTEKIKEKISSHYIV